MIKCISIILLFTAAVFAVICAALAGAAASSYSDIKDEANTAEGAASPAQYMAENVFDSFSEVSAASPAAASALNLPSGYDNAIIFVAFTGATAAAIALASAVRRIACSRRSKLGSLIELGTFSVWAVFWLAAVIVLAVKVHPFSCTLSGSDVAAGTSYIAGRFSDDLYSQVLGLFNSYVGQFSSACDEVKAAWAFAFLSLLLWLSNFGLAFLALICPATSPPAYTQDPAKPAQTLAQLNAHCTQLQAYPAVGMPAPAAAQYPPPAPKGHQSVE